MIGIASARLAMCPPLNYALDLRFVKSRRAESLKPVARLERVLIVQNVKMVPPSDPRSRQVRERDATKQRQGTSRSRHRIGLLERLFESESHAVVAFVVQGTDRHRTFMPCTSCHGLNLLRMRTPGPRPSSVCQRPLWRCLPSEAGGPRGAAFARAPQTCGSLRM